MAFELPALPYAFNALEPNIDARTMEIHHGKHHAAYVTNLNNAIKGTPLENKTLEEIMVEGFNTPAIRNNGGGHWNHSLFWTLLTPNAQAGPTGDLLDNINKTFGSLDELKKQFNQAGMTRFGSGWAWLCVHKGGKLEVCSTPNQDNPLMPGVGCSGMPILGLDVWEHAYYLHYQNRRAEYVENFWKIINWKEVMKIYEQNK